MPEYSREQIYDAMRRADAAGDGDAVKALAAALQSGASKEQIVAQAADSGLTVDEAALDANIASRDAGGPVNTFLPPEQPGIGAGVQNALGGYVEGVAGAYDFARDIAHLPTQGMNALTLGAASGLEGIGLEGPANFLRTGVERYRQDFANQGTAAGKVQELSPTPQGMEGARFAAQIIGGASIPFGPKAAPRVKAPVEEPVNAARQVVEAGKREGVRVMTSDVRPPKSFMGKLARATGERIPIAGTGGPRVKQAEERVEAVKQLAKDFGVEGVENSLEEVADDLAKTRGGKIAALAARKNKVIDGIEGPVQTPKAVAEIDTQIARLKGINEAKLAPVIKELERFKGALTSGKSLREIEENRRLLGEMFEDQSLASVKGVGQKAINAVYAPLRDDMGAFIKAQGGDEAFGAWKRSNDELAAMAGELDARSFKNVLQNAESTPENVARLLFSKKPSDVRRLYANLSPAGQEKAKAAVLHEAIVKSGGIDEVSPQRFANALQKFGSTTGIIFGDDAPRIEGIVRLLKATQQASVASAAPPTGVQNAPVIGAAVLTDWLGGLGSSATVAGLAGAAARLYESAAVRNLLTGLGKTKPGSKGEAAFIARIESALASQEGIGAKVANDNMGRSLAVEERREERRPQ